MRTDAFSRLYVLPGVYHCGNGEGPHQIDLLTPLMAWVEQGVAPEAIATRQPVQAVLTDFGAPRGAGGPPQGRRPNAEPPGGGRPGNGPAPGPGAQAAALGPVAVSGEKIERSRPVYPWPSMAAWNGSGDPGLASSFKRGTPVSFEMPQWAGMDFFAPYIPALR
jgi:feruloyl esterase